MTFHLGSLGRLRWPLPALSAWAAGWLAAALLAWFAEWPAAAVFIAGSVAGGWLATANAGHWRRAIAAAGFPVSFLLLSGGVAALGTPGGGAGWLVALALLLWLYPPRAWRDAPFFPTPAAALKGLAGIVTPAPARVLDAGCGLGHGLAALGRLWPGAALHGVEWSRPMAWLARYRLPHADIARGDMWAQSWAGFDLVYVFQRPETMPRAWTKACAEMADGAWFVSLEFAVPGAQTAAVVDAGVGRPVHVYRVRSVAQQVRRPRSTGARTGR